MILSLALMCGCDVDPAERMNAGNQQFDQARYGDAVEFYQAAQVAAPDSPEAYYNAAGAFSRLGDIESAINAYKQVLKTSDDNLSARTYFNMGNLYFEEKRYADAIDAYQEVLLLRPNDEDARHNLELALQVLVIVSSTPAPTDAFLSQNGTDDPTPTTSSETENLPTPLPTGGESAVTLDAPNSLPEDLASTPDITNLSPTYSSEEAEKLFDAIQQAQQPFPLVTVGTPFANTSNKDW